MTRIPGSITRPQRWLESSFRYAQSVSGCPGRKRARGFAVAGGTSGIGGTQTAVFQRYNSSTPSSDTIRNPLHRNPSRISSSVGSIYRPPGYFLGICDEPVILPRNNKIVEDSIRSCIKIDEDEIGEGSDGSIEDWKDLHEKGLNTEMSLCFLGTGAGSPANIRSTSGALLRLAGMNYMFDVGEGTQRQLQFAKGSSISKIEKIFISHLHGDHIFGLPGLLLSLQTSIMQADDTKGKKNSNNNNNGEGEEFTVKIYGPPGLFNYIASAIALSCTRLHLLNVDVYELTGGRVRRVTNLPSRSTRHMPRGSNARRDPFRDDYPEFQHNGGRLRRFQIPCENGVWNIQYNPLPLSREEITTPVRQKNYSGRTMVRQQQQDRIRIRAAEVDHMPGVATFGFVIEEDEPPRNLDVAKAKALGVSHRDKKYELLKHGFSVVADDGSGRTVEPHQVLKPPTKKARKIAFIGDNRGWTPQMTEICRDTDLLVHEATLIEEEPTRGHSTAAMAGRNASGCDAKLLILNHISPKMESNLSEVVRQAYEATGRKVSVLMSFDFMEVLVPWMGFGKPTITCESQSGAAENERTNES